MPYKGQLTRGVPFTIDLAGSPSGRSGITVVKINQRGGVHARAVTVEIGAALTVNELLGARIVRLILHVNPAPGDPMNVSVVQGTSQYFDQCTADAELVWDAVS